MIEPVWINSWPKSHFSRWVLHKTVQLQKILNSLSCNLVLFFLSLQWQSNKKQNITNKQKNIHGHNYGNISNFIKFSLNSSTKKLNIHVATIRFLLIVYKNWKTPFSWKTAFAKPNAFLAKKKWRLTFLNLVRLFQSSTFQVFLNRTKVNEFCIPFWFWVI